MMKYLLILALFATLAAFVTSQKITYTFAIFDQWPDYNSNFEPPLGSLTPGIIKPTLDPITKLPVLNSYDVNDPTNQDGKIMDPSLFKYWFYPDYATKTNYPLNLNLTLTKVDSVYQLFDNDFFPINYKGFDTDPNFRVYKDGDDNYQNFHFCLRMNTFFQYSNTDPPMKFNFKGDDDVWLFVNNRLALDLGGLHSAEIGSVEFTTTKAKELGLDVAKGGVYPFDFYYCERHTTESNLRLEINFPLKCEQKDYCGVCNGNGETCCDPNKCSLYQGNKCISKTCPAWNTPGVTIDNMYSKCTYANITYTDTKCTDYYCSPTQGKLVNSSFVPCPPKPCQSSTCDDVGGCSYKSTCQARNACESASCGSDGVTCQRVDTSARCYNATDKCNIYTCDPIAGCTKQAKCGGTVEGSPCMSYRCNATTGDCEQYVSQNPCGSCVDTNKDKCLQIATCDPVTNKYTYINKTTINDNNPCTLDLCNSTTGVVTHIPLDCAGCTECDPKGTEYKCKSYNTNCDDNNVCTVDQCFLNGTCSYTNVSCDDNDPCTDDFCDFQTGCYHTPTVCPSKGLCGTAQCSKEKGGCYIEPVVCPASSFCINSYCDDRLGCLALTRECIPDKTKCQYGVCNNATKECEFHDVDPLPFECKKAAVISTAVVAGVVVAGAVALGIALYGGKKGYDYWKETRGDKMTTSNTNPLFEAKPTSHENPLFVAEN